MSKTILIVESDAALSLTLRSELESRGFTVEETTDGKGSVELVRRLRPDLVVMAVDLSAGQNGYILCGKLKKDDELKAVPIVIMGNPDGFAQHSKLKTRADSYVAKPVDLDGFLTAVGALVGMPEQPGAREVDDSLSAADLLEDDAEEIAVDAELDQLDDAFADMSGPSQPDDALAVGSALDLDGPLETDASLDMAVIDEPLDAALGGDEEFAALDVVDGEDDVVTSTSISALDADEPLSGLDALPGLDDEPLGDYAPSAPAPRAAPPSVPAPPAPTPRAAPPPPPSPFSASRPPAPPATGSAADAGELRALRAQVAELQAALQGAQGRLAARDERTHELEAELERKAAELESARSTGGKADREFFALREAGNRKDKEILRLKAELHEKDQELVNLREREVQLEQQLTDGEAELARLRALASRAEQASVERRRVEQQLQQAREEARAASARADTLEAELAPLQEQLRELHPELEALREEAGQLREQLEEARREASEQQAAAEQAGADLATLQAELEALRAATQRNDERVARLYARLKADEKLRERTKKALAIAQQLLDEQPAADGADEAAA